MPSEYGRGRRIANAERLFSAGDWDEAIRILSVRRLKRSSRGEQLLLANLLQAIGKPERAGQAYRALTRQYPHDPMVLMDQADFYLASGRFGLAQRAYERVLRQLSKSRSKAKRGIYIEAVQMLSHSIVKQRRVLQAIRIVANGLSRFPDSVTLHRELHALARRIDHRQRESTRVNLDVSKN